jgi:hypothetical protein
MPNRLTAATLLALLTACGGDEGVVTACGGDKVVVTCTYDYTSELDLDSGEYPGFTASCDEWAEHGEVQMGSLEGACEAEGYDLGFTYADCVCTVDTGTCTFPNGVND